MFEGTRSELVKRLSALIDRYEENARRAQEALEFSDLATRMGLGADDQLTTVLAEIASKSHEQAGLCGQWITHLVVDRSFPPIFSRSVVKAERFADQCEQILDQLEDGQMAGKRAFEQRFGSEGAAC